MKTTANPLSTSDTDAFMLFMEQWQERLNMLDWRIVRATKPAAKSNMAQINRMDLAARLATYAIGQDFGAVPVTGQSVEEIACHESLHVFLHELIETARDPASSQETLEGVEHRIIHVLVNLLVPKD